MYLKLVHVRKFRILSIFGTIDHDAHHAGQKNSGCIPCIACLSRAFDKFYSGCTTHKNRT